MVNPHKPLLVGAVDDRIVATPAVRVGVRQAPCRSHKVPTRFDKLNDRLIGFKNLFPLVFGQTFGELAGVAHGAIDFDAIPHTRFIVLTTVPRRGVDTTGSVFSRDIIRQHAQEFAFQERMLDLNTVEFPPLETCQHLGCIQSRLRHGRLVPPALQDVNRAILAAVVHGHVFKFAGGKPRPYWLEASRAWWSR